MTRYWGAIAGLLLLFGIGVFGLLAPAPADDGLDAEAQARLAILLAEGQSQGYGPALKQLGQSLAVLDVEVRDRRDLLVARWPGVPQVRGDQLPAALDRLRRGTVALVGQVRSYPLRHEAQTVGELRVSYLRGMASVTGRFMWSLLLIGLAIWGLISLPWGQDRLRRAQARMPRDASQPAAMRLQRALPRMGVVLDQAQLGILLLNAQQRVRYINRTALGMLGRDDEQSFNRPVYSVLRFSEQQIHPFGQVDGSPASQEARLTLLRPDGSTLPVHLMTAPLRGRPEHDDDSPAGGQLVLLRDASVEHGERESLRHEAEIARRTLDALHDGVLVTDRFGRVLRHNRRAAELFGFQSAALSGVPISKLLPVPFLNDPRVSLSDYAGAQSPSELPRVVAWRRDAATFPVDLRVCALEQEPEAFLLLIRDSREQQRQGNLSARLGRLLDYAAEEIYIFDAESLYITEANRQAREQLGFSAEQLSRMTMLHLAPGLDRQRLEQDLQSLRSGQKRQVSYRSEHRRADGKIYPVSLRLSYSHEEQPPVFMALAQDITEQRAAEQRLEFLAHNDGLTALPNREVLMSRLDALLERANGPPSTCLCFMDLDDFKGINDQHGHAVGDAVLVEFARRLKSVVREDDLVVRLSGDEFVVVAQEQPQGEELPRVAQRILSVMQAAMMTDVGALDPGISIGVTWLRPGDTAQSALRRADAAMYQAKAAGGRQCVIQSS